MDGKSADSEVAEFDLHFDKVTFKWIASSVAEKKAFVTCLYKVMPQPEAVLVPLTVPPLVLQLVHKYLDRKKPGFVNVDEEKLQGMIMARLDGIDYSHVGCCLPSDLLRSVDPKTRVGGTEDVEEVQQGQ